MLATRRLYIFLLWTPMVATFEIPVDVTSSLGGIQRWRQFGGTLPSLVFCWVCRLWGTIDDSSVYESLLVSLGGGRLPNVVRVNVVLGSYRVAFRRLRGGVESRL